jgi:hypothetical protein
MSYTTSSPSTAPGSSPNLSKSGIIPITIRVLEILENFSALVDQLGEPPSVSDIPLEMLVNGSQRFRILYVRRAAVGRVLERL